MRTLISFRRIHDRQNLIHVMETRKQGLEPYMTDRTDMFWATAIVTDDGLRAELEYCIEGSPYEPNLTWRLSFQYGSKLLDTVEVREKVMKKWRESPECIQATKWFNNLLEAGYFDRGRFGAPNANTACCKHCRSYFEIGTSHPHTYLSKEFTGTKKRLIHHHRLMEATIEERGLVKLSRSALPNTPSLEEKGKLEWHVVGSKKEGA